MMPSGTEWLFVGILPVYGFIIISGLVIATLIDTKREDYLPYIIRRYFRLAPLIIVAIPVVYVMHRLAIPGSWPSDLIPFRIFAEVTLFHGLLPDNVIHHGANSFINPAWSISLEWQFYLVAPFVIYCLRKGGWWLLPILGFLVLAWTSGAGLQHTSADLFGFEAEFRKPSYLLAAFHLFLIGICLYYAAKHITIPKQYAQFGIVAIFVLAFFSIGDPRLYRWMVLPLGGLVAYLVLFKDSALTRLFEHRVMTFLGRISYSTYLLHMLTLQLAQVLLRNSIDPGWTLFAAMSVIAIPSTLLLSWLGYRYIEAPFMELGKRLAERVTRNQENTGQRPEA